MKKIFVPALRLTAFALLFFACFRTETPGPDLIDDGGYLTVDSNLVIDNFHFTTEACAEVIPASFVNADSVWAGTVAAVQVISTACYHVHVMVEDSAGLVVRSFDQYFKIYNRINGEKDRGESSYVTWDGLDDKGKAVPRLRYLWRMLFDYGGGNLLKRRADIKLY